MTATIEGKLNREANSNKNFRDSAHSRLEALEESIQASAKQQQALQEAIRTQQEDSTTRQEAVANQIHILTTTMQSIHDANAQSQRTAQENMLAMQQLTQTTFQQTQATQQNLTTLTGTINDLAQLIQAQPHSTPRTTANIIRSERRHQLPPQASTPNRPTPHERTHGSESPDKKKTCQQSTPLRPTSEGRLKDSSHPANGHPGATPARQPEASATSIEHQTTTPTRPPSASSQRQMPRQLQISTPPVQRTTYLHNNPYATLAGDVSEDEEETKHENDPIHFTPEELDVIQLLGASTTEADRLEREEDTHQYHEETPSSEEHNRELGQEVQPDQQALNGKPNAPEDSP